MTKVDADVVKTSVASKVDVAMTRAAMSTSKLTTRHKEFLNPFGG
jgi:hypothetical protein